MHANILTYHMKATVSDMSAVAMIAHMRTNYDHMQKLVKSELAPQSDWLSPEAPHECVVYESSMVHAASCVSSCTSVGVCIGFTHAVALP